MSEAAFVDGTAGQEDGGCEEGCAGKVKGGLFERAR